MSNCRRHDCDRCECECNDRWECDRDYWFRSDPYYHQRCGNFGPTFPRVLQGTLIIPQTAIPIRIVLTSPFGAGVTPFIGANTANTQASILQSISLSPQTIAGGAAVPFDTNLIASGNGVFGF